MLLQSRNAGDKLQDEDKARLRNEAAKDTHG
jgi:hypothetical protein